MISRRALLASLVGALVLSGCGTVGATSEPQPPGTPSDSPSAPVTPGPPSGPPNVHALARSAPTRIDIPRIGARSTLVPLGLAADGTIEVPSVLTPMQAGWFTGAPTPGEIGPAVVLGHVDGDHQPGIFYRLRELEPGDEIGIGRADGGTARFEVTAVDQVAKETFPTDAVYGDTVRPELRLITCGGGFDRATRSYRDNIIVYAVLR